MAWPAVVAAIAIAVGTTFDIIQKSGKKKSQEKMTTQEGERSERIAMEQLGLRREEMGLLEKERGFGRIMDLMGAGTKLRDRTRGIQRLSKIRAAR